MTKNRILIIMIICFLGLTGLVIFDKVSVFDNTISNLIQTKIPENLTNIIKIITTIGGTRILPIIVIITSVIFTVNKKENYGILILTNSILSTLSYIVIKPIIQRPRPYPFHFIEETGYSFPSGHSTASMAFFGLMIYIIWKEIQSKKLKYFLISILSIWIILIGVSRIYFNVHYPSDVVAGFILGGIAILFTITIIAKKLENTLKKSKNSV